MKKISFLILSILGLVAGTAQAQYTTLHNFNGTDGALPYAALTLSGERLYGMTVIGGAYNYGCIFSMDTNGNQYTVLHSFDSLHGEQPFGSLTLSSGKLYGVTAWGGTSDTDGVVFSMDTNGSKFKVLLNFNAVNGANPEGDLTLSGYKLYGMAATGGANGYGDIFSIDTNGGGFKDLFDFNGTSGAGAVSSLTLSGNKFYGMTVAGGVDSLGNIFSIDTNGTGYHDLFDFLGYPTGAYPYGSLTLSGNKLYGMTNQGGIDNVGSIFSINTNGSDFNVLYYFNYDSGASPYGNLTLDGSQLYGLTSAGGSQGSGNAFSIDTNGSRFNNIFSFTFRGPNTAYDPSGTLTLGNGGKFYGFAENGGKYGDGIAFEFGGCTNTFDEPICMVTVDTATNYTEVIWERTNSPYAGGYGYYNIYKDTLAGFFLYNFQQLNALSEFIDTAISAIGAPSYELSTVDSCGESALSAPQTGVFLNVSIGINANILNWTAYAGFIPTEYIIFRGLSQHSLVKIDSVATNVLTYTDSNPPAGAVYAIEAVSPHGACIPTTHGPNKRLMTALSGSFSNGVNTKLLGVQRLASSINKLNIYPNPSNGQFTIQDKNGELSAESNSSLEVYNVVGEKVYSQLSIAHYPLTINLSNQPGGVYLYRVLSEDGSLISEGKMVIQK